MAKYENRYMRQQDIIQRQEVDTSIIGVGAIGRQVSMMLAAMGIEPVKLIDMDYVAPVNLSAQGWREIDIKLPKVTAAIRAQRDVNGGLKWRGVCKPYKPKLVDSEVIFLAVDNIETRKAIYEAEKQKGVCKFLVDARMAAEHCSVFGVWFDDELTTKHYETTFFSSGEAFPQRCTSKTTIYCANVAAGLMVAEFAKYLRGTMTQVESGLNIYSGDYEVVRL